MAGRQRNYRAEFAARKAKHPRLTARGASGHGAKPLRPRQVTQANVFDLSARDQASRRKATRALGRMRHEHLSLSEAARREGTNPDTVRRWASSGLEKGRGGRWQAKATDDLPRIVPVVSGGTVYPEVAVSQPDASLVSRHLRALRRYLRGENDEALAPFAGVVIHGRLPDGTERNFELEADLDYVDALAASGALDDLVVGS